MGKRNCAIEGCNALEFRSTRVCNKHMGMGVEIPELASEPKQVQPKSTEEFDCPKGCGKMSYEDVIGAGQTRDSNLGFALLVGGPVFGVIYFLGSFIVFPQPGEHPNIGVLFLFFVSFCIGAFMMITFSKNHVCTTCKGILLDSKTIVQQMGDENATKLMSLIDGMEESSSELQCPVCDETMGSFSVAYVPADDYRSTHRGHNLPTPSNMSPVNILEAALIAIVPNAEEQLDLDACGDCGVVWFDGSEKGRLEYSTSMKETL